MFLRTICLNFIALVVAGLYGHCPLDVGDVWWPQDELFKDFRCPPSWDFNLGESSGGGCKWYLPEIPEISFLYMP